MPVGVSTALLGMVVDFILWGSWSGMMSLFDTGPPFLGNILLLQYGAVMNGLLFLVKY